MRKILLAASIVGLLIAGGVFVKDYLDSQFTTTIVAKISIPAGAVITADMVQEIPMHVSGVHPYATKVVGQIVGKVAKQAIEPGEQFLSSKLDVLTAGSSPNLRLTVLTGDVLDSIGRYISVGDIVDIGVRREDGSSRLVLTGIPVVNVTDANNNPLSTPSILNINNGLMNIVPGTAAPNGTSVAKPMPEKVYVLLDDPYQKAELNRAEAEGKLYILIHSKKSTTQ